MFRSIFTLLLITAMSVNAAIAQTATKSPATDKSPAPAKAVPKDPPKTYPANPPLPAPGWIVVEESVLWPLYKEPHFVLYKSAEAFRAHDEKLAVAELRKASSWLHLIDSHATVEGRYQLVQARSKIDRLADDLENGNVVDAERLTKAIATAYHAIANEHYLKAKEVVTGSTADMDSNTAAKHLVAAGLYMQSAARSAFKELDAKTKESVKAFDAIGEKPGNEDKIDPKSVADQLRVIGDGLQQLGAELQKP